MFWHMPINETIPVAHTGQVRLFCIRQNKAVRIPREFELPGREVTIRKAGDRPILEPSRRKSLLHVLAAKTPLAAGDEFPDVDETSTPLDEDPFVSWGHK